MGHKLERTGGLEGHEGGFRGKSGVPSTHACEREREREREREGEGERDSEREIGRDGGETARQIERGERDSVCVCVWGGRERERETRWGVLAHARECVCVCLNVHSRLLAAA